MMFLRKMCASITRSSVIQDGKSCLDITFGLLKSYSSSSSMIDLDLTCPETWYPHARGIQRTIVLHVGPTNSGKREAALKRLASCSSGLYCAPQRHMAWNVARRMNKSNIPCHLLTDCENETTSGARHISMTVDMIDVATYFECAVIDDVEMVGCAQKGFMYTRALLGILSKEIHICGEPYCLDLIKKLLDGTGDSVEVQYYDILSPIVLLDSSLGTYSNVQKGDCIVTNSRVSVFDVMNRITSRGCAMLYGSLPCEVLTKQACKFSEFYEGITVLVATNDVIERDYNLDIGRIVFASMTKRDGTLLSPANVHRIAGRAGRYGSRYPASQVTCVDANDVPILKTILESVQILEKACIFPTLDMLSSVSSTPNMLDKLDLLFSGTSIVKDYFLVNPSKMLEIAALVDKLNLTFPEKYRLCTSSLTDIWDADVARILLKFADDYQTHGIHLLTSIDTRMVGDLIQNPNRVSLQNRMHLLEHYNKHCEVYIRVASLLQGSLWPHLSCAYEDRDRLLKYFFTIMEC